MIFIPTIGRLIITTKPGALPPALADVFVTNHTAAIPARPTSCFHQDHRRTRLACVARGKDIIRRGLVGALEHVLLGQFFQVPERHTSDLGDLRQRPSAHAVFVLVVHHPHGYHPHTLGRVGAPAQLGVVAVVAKVKLC